MTIRTISVSLLLSLSCVLFQTNSPASEGAQTSGKAAVAKKESTPERPKNLLSKLNTADLKNLARIPGIGPARAATIQKYRPLKKLDELILLPGFGEKTVQTILRSARTGKR